VIAHGDPPTYLTFERLGALGVPHATTTRHCPGVTSPTQATAPLAAAARPVLAEAGLDLARFAYARQVHGADVASAPSSGGFAGAVDILTTTEHALPLAIFTADCLPIVLYDAGAPALVVAHVGWRGTVKGAAAAAVRAIVKLGARADRLAVAVGPSIGPCCYEVDAPVVDAFRATYPERWQEWMRPGRAAHFMLDLWAANEAILTDAGIDPTRLENPRLCTACHPDLLYSYRKGNRGRLVTVAALP
jgi:polyphenol oxidase